MKTNMLLMTPLAINTLRRLAFPCAVFAAAVSFGAADVATAKQCLVSTIAFTSSHDNAMLPPFSAAEIYLMDADGTNLRRLTNNTDGDGFPALSPDGKKIVFDSNR